MKQLAKKCDLSLKFDYRNASTNKLSQATEKHQ